MKTLQRSRLIRETKLDTKRRVHETLPLAVVVDIGGVVVQQLQVLGVEGDDLLVGVDALGGDGLGEDGVTVVDLHGKLVLQISVSS